MTIRPSTSARLSACAFGSAPASVAKRLARKRISFTFLLQFERLDVVPQSEFGQLNFCPKPLTLLANMLGTREFAAQGL